MNQIIRNDDPNIKTHFAIYQEQGDDKFKKIYLTREMVKTIIEAKAQRRDTIFITGNEYRLKYLLVKKIEEVETTPKRQFYLVELITGVKIEIDGEEEMIMEFREMEYDPISDRENKKFLGYRRNGKIYPLQKPDEKTFHRATGGSDFNSIQLRGK